MKNFEKFIYKRRQSPDKATVTVTKEGIINFNLATMETYIKNNDYVILYYNRKDSVIGIQLTNKDSAEAYKIRKYREGKYGNITAIAFLKYYKIQHSKSHVYTTNWDEENNMLLIELKEKREKGVSKQIPQVK